MFGMFGFLGLVEKRLVGIGQFLTDLRLQKLRIQRKRNCLPLGLRIKRSSLAHVTYLQP